ncbi:MAG: esterase-like activity of phytase family protein [Sandaracinaceae bacterium]
MSRVKCTLVLAFAMSATACIAPGDDLGTRESAVSDGQGSDARFDGDNVGRPPFFGPTFERIATFPVFLNTDVDDETVAEIVAATEDGRTVVYTDSETENIGFVDITNPFHPSADGIVPVDGEPTSVAVAGRYALAAVNTSDDFINTSGHLAVIDIHSRAVVRKIDLGGQPDAVAVSPDKRYAAVAIENERDEDLGDGEPPQFPPGFVVIVDLVGGPDHWSTRKVDLVGVPDLFPSDPEPEFVDINHQNIAAVTLQENNHVALIRLSTGRVIEDWSTGTADLAQIDTLENELIEQIDSLDDVPREPDAVTWTSNFSLATADEGDLFGGSRGFTIFNRRGDVRFTSGNSLEHLTARIGHYPEERSENKGNEPEGIEFGRYGGRDYLFVGSERSSVILVYELVTPRRPRFVQVLPAGVGPEGLLAIPQRGLFVASSEVDDRGDGIRSSIAIYKRLPGLPSYPTLASRDRYDGTPIPWAALSALAANPNSSRKAYTVYDSFFRESRIFVIDLRPRTPRIDAEVVLHDFMGNTFDLDPEGLASRETNGFWLASEGAGSVDDPSRPVTSRNQLFKVEWDGLVTEIVDLPDATNMLQRRFGFEGVTITGHPWEEVLYVAFQREWVGDPDGLVRIGRYDTVSGEWAFFYYPLDAVESPNDGWVGLSEIIALGDDEFAVVERDNQGGPDARVKRIYRFSVRGLTPGPEGGSFPTVHKTLVRDLIGDLESPGGLVIEKVEGLMRTRNGDAWIVTDNDGVDDNSGETQLINLGRIFR